MLSLMISCQSKMAWGYARTSSPFLNPITKSSSDKKSMASTATSSGFVKAGIPSLPGPPSRTSDLGMDHCTLVEESPPLPCPDPSGGAVLSDEELQAKESPDANKRINTFFMANYLFVVFCF